MQDAEKVTPLAGRVMLGKKEAATSAIFVVILINMVVLVLVRAAGVLMSAEHHVIFWVLVSVLLAADIALSPTCFYYALKEVKENNAAPVYTITMTSDGMLVLYNQDGRTQTFNSAEVIKVIAHKARFNWNSLAGDSGRGYGTIRFVVCSKMGRIVKYKVKYVVNCESAAEFLRGVLLVKDKEQTDNQDNTNIK